MNEETKTLCEAEIGERCIIKAIASLGAKRRRLMDLGFCPGAVVECVGKSPLGDPAAYSIRAAIIALRDIDAKDIQIEREK